ncbi:MAG: hypothetical protein PHG66_03620 [Candidatus Colwellbacteria bacterium]|nr:hypothetical protein [Candidatus Colwellbacteria bacterium]
MDNKEQEIERLIEKAMQGKKGKLDLSSDEDLSVAVMNLISIEEHLFFTGAKTGRSDYYDLLAATREIRKDLLKKLIKEYEGEVWCISKHLLAASMRLMEVGTKQLGQGNKAEAEDLFKKAYDLYSLFWGINLKLINVEGVKEIADDSLSVSEINKKDPKKENGTEVVEEKKGFGKLGEIVKRIVDCCIE